MAMENLTIVQYKDTLRYARVRSGAYRPQLQQLKVGDYMCLQREAPTTLDVQVGRTILWVKIIFPSGFFSWTVRMDKNAGTIQRIAHHVTCLLKGLYI
jgi:hypothetical protein